MLYWLQVILQPDCKNLGSGVPSLMAADALNYNLPYAKAHQNTPSFNRKSPLTELGMSQLHHYVGPDNISELQAIHKDAYPTAIFYLSTILGLYVLGLFVILVHYMNSSYGKWAWTLNDVWDELRYVSIPRLQSSMPIVVPRF